MSQCKYRISSVDGVPGTPTRSASTSAPFSGSRGDREHRERDKERERMERDRERERQRDRERDREEHELKVSGGSSCEDRVYTSPSSSVAAERNQVRPSRRVTTIGRESTTRCPRWRGPSLAAPSVVAKSSPSTPPTSAVSNARNNRRGRLSGGPSTK